MRRRMADHVAYAAEGAFTNECCAYSATIGIAHEAICAARTRRECAKVRRYARQSYATVVTPIATGENSAQRR